MPCPYFKDSDDFDEDTEGEYDGNWGCAKFEYHEEGVDHECEHDYTYMLDLHDHQDDNDIFDASWFE